MRTKKARRIDIDGPMEKAIESSKQKVNENVKKLKDVYENPEKYTHTVKLSFNHLEFKTAKPFNISLLHDNGEVTEAILDPDYCAEFGVLVNNAFYSVISAEINGENIIFDYKIVDETEIYSLATEQSLLIDASEKYKASSKIVFEIEGQIGNLERRNAEGKATECCLYSFDENLWYQWLIVYDSNLQNKINFKAGAYMRMTILAHEFSLSVLDCEEIPKPANARKLRCFADYRED